MTRTSLALITLIVLAVSCAAPAPRRPTAAARAAASAAAGDAPPVAPASRARSPRPTSVAMRVPQRGITTPMSGEPSSALLASEARLAPSTCEIVTTEHAQARIKEMRAAVKASFQTWHDGQPACWEEMRREHAWRKEMERLRRSGGSGGLGLTGIGEGGGGYGYGAGIGLGAVGTIGHGAGRGASGATVRTARTASGTNNQVAGVDEPDLVKTDGKYVYLASGGALRIIEALKPRIVSTTKVPGTVREMFIAGDRAVVYSSLGDVGPRCTYGYDCQFAGDGSATTVSVFDVSDRHAPALVRAFTLSGSLVTARRIGAAVHTVVADNDAQAPSYETWPNDLPMCGTPEAAVRAKFSKLEAENERRIRTSARKAAVPTLTENGKSRALCDGLFQTKIRDGEAFTTIVSFDVQDDAAAPTSASVQSRPGAVFASESALYLSIGHGKNDTVGRSGRWYSHYAAAVNEVSEIHKFRIGGSPKDTRYVGGGTVPGHVLNQFAMDEWYGYLRVATTMGRVPDPAVRSAVSVLSETSSGSLVRVGAIDGIAPGEDIRAVRFEEDRGYVVTFKKTDPLFVIDLFEATRPSILGELKIPGFSTYMHRIDPEHLLSIGFDANDHGDFAYFDGVILQLFDVKDPTAPKLVHKEKIGTRGSSSEAATDHLAFNYFASAGLLAIPMTICEGGADGRNGDRVAFSGLLVYDVDLERGFTKLGGVDHGPGRGRGSDVTCATWWSKATSAVKRSVFLDDLVYSIATDRVKVQSMSHFGLDVASFSLSP